MSAVVNLRLVRKQKARAEKEKLAAENRALHGRSKLEKSRDRLAAEKSQAFVEAHRLEPREGESLEPPDRGGKA